MTYRELLEKNPSYIDWDFELYDKPYQIVRYDGYNNEDYACYEIKPHYKKIKDYFVPDDLDIQVINCHGVRGNAPNWEISQTKKAWTKTKWDETSVRFTCNTVISRNGVPFFEFGGSEDYAYHKAKASLIEFTEGPINFHSRFWREEIEGRKIEYNGEPAIVKRVSVNPFYMWIVPVEGKFKPPHHWDHDDDDFCMNREAWDEEYAEGLRVDSVLSPDINWYPKDK